MISYRLIDDPTSCYNQYHYFTLNIEDYKSNDDFHTKVHDILAWVYSSTFLGTCVVSPTRSRLMSERYDFSIFILLFENKNDAMLFKLRWY